MHSVRVTNTRLPQVYQVCKAPSVSHNATRNMSFFPRAFQHDLAPMFRLIDAFDTALATPRNAAQNTLRTFQPRFDVKEHADSYELQGELPGIESRDVQIEWSDSNVLSIKGRTESVKEQSSEPAPEAIEAQDGTKTPQSVESDSGSYHKVSVEDEDEDATPSNTVTETPQQQQTQQQSVSSQIVDREKSSTDSETSRWWVSERSVGEFARSFSFPSRVDQDNVKASMDKGILRILVPKAQAPVSRRIEIH
nr:30 kda heat shock protein [Quercus suber]